MKIDQKLLDELTAKAKANPRHRMHYDLRDSEEEMSMRMLSKRPNLGPGLIWLR